jgi:hypothetical protein
MPTLAVSPKQFAILTSELLLAEMAGHGPAECTARACRAAGIKMPRAFEPVDIVVDPELGDPDVRG